MYTNQNYIFEMIIKNHFYNALSGVISELPVKKKASCNMDTVHLAPLLKTLAGLVEAARVIRALGCQVTVVKQKTWNFLTVLMRTNMKNSPKLAKGLLGMGFFFPQASEFLLISLWEERCICTLYIAFIHRSGKSTE